MKFFDKIKELMALVKRIRRDNEEQRFILGSLLAKNIAQSKSIQEAEFKVFSQFGDDGIIQFLVNNIRPASTKFVEFGVENYEESNTRFLLMFNNWQGLIIDGSNSNIEYIKNSSIYWQYELTAVNSFITAENINHILAENGFNGNIGLLSIDIDGNDYWVWQAITVTEADIVVAEYNSLFGWERAITVPYKADFFRGAAHYSYLYFGASLAALCELAEAKGYAFVGCNQAGNNAYFVKKHLVGSLPIPSIEKGYVAARFREGRDKDKKLTFDNEASRLNTIKGLPVFNTRTGLMETI
ncbi:hypothetical protein [Spirosoma pulveris]